MVQIAWQAKIYLTGFCRVCGQIDTCMHLWWECVVIKLFWKENREAIGEDNTAIHSWQTHGDFVPWFTFPVVSLWEYLEQLLSHMSFFVPVCSWFAHFLWQMTR